uniref:Uncharacterized protein n=1 Tax=viral metagenome TaxID=1070528 RepID=A0A6H1ZJ10_9ZZZZ
MEIKERTCENCLYLATHEKCDNPTSCLGSCKEVTANDNQYLFRNFVAGDGITRITDFENRGERSIVISGMGEAEVNVLDSPEDTLERLIDVSEQCGYFTTQGAWTDFNKEIEISLELGLFRLIYIHNKLRYIKRGKQLCRIIPAQ